MMDIRVKTLLAAMAITISVSALASSVSPEDRAAFLRPAMVPAPEDNKLTPERAELGKNLFFDPRLSGSNWISCATCHNPALGWSDGLATGLGHGMAFREGSTAKRQAKAQRRGRQQSSAFHR